MTRPFGATAGEGGTWFAVGAPAAARVELCLFDGAAERRVALDRQGDRWAAFLPVGPGQRYGYRAYGGWAPERGLCFDPAKLLVDPYAVELDRRFAWDPRLATPGAETGALVPRAIVPAPAPPVAAAPPRSVAGGLVYELNVRGFTMRHPDVPPAERGTVAALARPAVIAHLRRLGVAAVELMPITAWIDERHLPPLGLRNAWGYNPVVPMALDPGLVPGGVAELRRTVAALHAAGIGVILDLVLNHSGESDRHGATLSFRGLDDRHHARAPDGTLINDTGTGNTLDFAYPPMRALALATLRHFVLAAGVDGFRFDLAPVLARGPGFDPHAPFLVAVAADPVLADRVLIAEPWDIGPGGYQLGRFPDGWLEWNDRFRDDARRFWRGDRGLAGALATRLAGSADLFAGPWTRSVNFLAAHDGFTLADLVTYEGRHNEANGEGNRDGHGDNHSWNHGVEGPSADPAVRRARAADLRALLATLFASRGTIMLTAGDEFGRSQAGNNNAYAQDELGWVDWAGRDRGLEAFVAALGRWRAAHPALGDLAFRHDARWHALDGEPLTPGDWEAPDLPGFELRLPVDDGGALCVRIDRAARACAFGRRDAAGIVTAAGWFSSAEDPMPDHDDTGPNARPLDDTIAGTGPGIPDDALAPGEEELPTPPSQAEVERIAHALDAPVPPREG